jgi:acyl-homoserine-lactone acylase
MRRFPPLALAVLLPLVTSLSAQTPYRDRVEIRRTAHGVPHVLAQDFGALGYGLAWAQLEDHGSRIVLNLVRARGGLAEIFGRDSLESDFTFVESHQRAVETFHLLDADLRHLFAGWAAAANRWVEAHAAEYAAWRLAPFTPQDAAALWTDETVEPATQTFLRALRRRRPGEGESERAFEGLRDNIGSNAWAFAPTRTTSGRAILLRNPHLSWRDFWYGNYYEAHITVPGQVDFYGDFRVGFPLYFNGGFNAFLGWATTNNAPDLEEVYALDLDPERPDHVRFDGASVPLQRVELRVRCRSGDALVTEVRTVWRTPLGPVIERMGGKAYVLKSPGWGEYRKAEQFLRMMRARSLSEWRAAVAMRAHTESNLSYADRDGNILYFWNAALPRRPHSSGGDTAAVPARTTDDVWTSLYAPESLPQLLNPRTGYIQNANDPYHFTNLESVVDSARFPPPDFPSPDLRLRSQLSLLLVTSRSRVSLEDVVRLKHSPRMLAAERFADDLIAAVRAANPTGEAAAGLAAIEAWDRTASPEARGVVLFMEWYDLYLQGSGASGTERWRRAWATRWEPARPVTTPDGLADPARAAAAFAQAAAAVQRRYGRVDPAWSDVVRVRRGDVNVPVMGCPGVYGCFRVLGLRARGDGTFEVAGGDGWVLVVEFGRDGPRARSILAYGQSSLPDSPWFSDQAAMYARGELKEVAFSEAEIERQMVRRYRPE